GRLFDLQGQPVANAKLRPVRVLAQAAKPARPADDMARHLLAETRRQHGFQFQKNSSLRGSPLWPASVTTDAGRRLRAGGVRRGKEVDLLVEDDRFASQELTVQADGKEHALPVQPPRRVTGRVVAADTGKPVAGVWVGVSTFRSFPKLGRSDYHLADGQTGA